MKNIRKKTVKSIRKMKRIKKIIRKKVKMIKLLTRWRSSSRRKL